MTRSSIRATFFGILLIAPSAPATAADKPVKVFVLAGQSNMEGTVAFVGTRGFWRGKGVSPTGQAYHWNTNAETYYLIGEAMGTAMKKLCEKKRGK